MPPRPADAASPDDGGVRARIEQAVASSWAQRLSCLRDVRVAIGCSGGCDSSVLLDALARVLGADRVVALHVHHGLSPQADAWLEHARASAARLNVVFDHAHLGLDRASGNLEAHARDRRYAALHRLAVEHGAKVLALAHHRDDQAETLLLQLARGAGVAGLACMPAWRPVDGLHRWRPLLDTARAELERAARSAGIDWIDDESNRDPRHTRNAMRLHVLPALERAWPQAKEGVARAVRHMQAAYALEREVACADLKTMEVEGALDVEALRSKSEVRQAAALREWLRQRGARAPHEAQLAEALRQLFTSAADRRVSIALRDGRLRRSRGLLRFESSTALRDVESLPSNGAAKRTGPSASSHAFMLDWTGQVRWELPEWQGRFEFSSAGGIPRRVFEAGPLRAIPRRGGERFRFGPDRPSRPLKRCYQQMNVPAWEREGAPLLYAGDQLLWVPGLGEQRAWTIENTPTIGIRWHRQPV